jgi:hypothetical protein
MLRSAARIKRRHIVPAPLHLGGINLHRRRQHILQRLVRDRIGLAALERVARGGAEIRRFVQRLGGAA